MTLLKPLELFLVVYGVFFVGWRSHRWFCCKRKGCPLWQRDNELAWLEKLSRRYRRTSYARYPTPRSGVPLSNTNGVEPVPTPMVKVDSKNNKGIPSTLGLAADTDARKES